MKIIEKVRARKVVFLNDPTEANNNAELAAQAIQGGISSTAWENYMQQYKETDEQLARLLGTDGTRDHPVLRVRRAYLVANAICGAGTTDDLDRRVETIDDGI